MTEQKREADRLIYAKQKLERARKHIDEFDQKAGDYFRSGVVDCFRKDVPGRGYQIIAKLKKAPPDDLPVIAGEAAVQMRSALDKLIGALVVLNDPKAGKASFPFGGDVDQEFPSNGHKKDLRNLTDEQRALVFAQKPYLGGDDLLWSINKLANIDKHNDGLIKAASGANFCHGELGFDEPTDMISDHIELAIAGQAALELPLGEEVALMTVFAKPPPQFKGQIGFGVSFGAPSTLEDKPVAPTLREMHQKVTNIIKEFEEAFF